MPNPPLRTDGRPDPGSVQPASNLRLGLAALPLSAALAVAAHAWLAPAPELRAGGGGGGVDHDGDGLTDVQESIIGTDPLVADSDADGGADLAELAAATDPLDDQETIMPGFSIGMVGREEDGVLTVETAIYLPGGVLNGLDLGFGFYSQGQWIPIPASLVLASGNVELHPSGSDLVLQVSTNWSADVVKSFGTGSFYSKLNAKANGMFLSGGTLDLTQSGGVLSQIKGQSAGGGLGAGAALVPLTPTPELPETFTPGLVCLQDTLLVGSEDGALIYEVQSADCVTSFTSCSSDCATTSGSLIEVLDPLALVGG